MNNRASIVAHVLEAVKELNQQLPPQRQIPVTEEALLLAEGGVLDSLGMALLIVMVEERFQQALGVEISLSEEADMSRMEQIFQSVKTLTDHIASRIG